MCSLFCFSDCRRSLAFFFHWLWKPAPYEIKRHIQTYRPTSSSILPGTFFKTALLISGVSQLGLGGALMICVSLRCPSLPVSFGCLLLKWPRCPWIALSVAPWWARLSELDCPPLGLAYAFLWACQGEPLLLVIVDGLLNIASLTCPYWLPCCCLVVASFVACPILH